uniref:Amino acid/amide ABC transporter substrate-binding protein, HAAT family n=1 Tax=Candidatus Kentrum sp. TUN TaxID=2126343 RepID=A0A450ZFH2_9GAMM|nr:MAG: amino acid/amide ABC transporter substrate-binding protein, HAAT family [Candidatus Kentron sp. TUN]VFK52831.1 MAG: amino acid/amide ABC transporter substrate-binding protein, HAAT family [Candidatus Kentron sp. TUN]
MYRGLTPLSALVRSANKFIFVAMLVLVVLTTAITDGIAAERQYAPGISDTEIKIGNTSPYSGPASTYGTIGKGVKAYFDKVNSDGGVNGRRINFITLDDGYSPPKTKELFRKLIEREKVAFIFQSIGTQTNSAVHRYINKKNIPHLFVASGATRWGQPKRFPWTMGWSPTYRTEGYIYGAYLLEINPNAKVAILYQNDDYGKDYVRGFKNALGDRVEAMVVAEETYEATDPTIDSQIINLRASGADTFYNVTIPKFAAQAIRKVYDIDWKPLHLLNSASASINATLRPAGPEKSKGIVTTTYLKDPTDVRWHQDPEYKEWIAWMDKWYPQGDKDNYFNVYAYAVAQTMVKVLEQAGDDLTRENIMRQAANLRKLRVKMLLPGITLNTSPEDFFPIEAMQMMRFDGEKWMRFGDLISMEDRQQVCFLDL